MNIFMKEILISFYKDMVTKSHDKKYSKVITGLNFSIPVSYLDFLDEIRI